MKVFKFGGASIKDSAAVHNMMRILDRFPNDQLFIVLSAMGKVTNGLEQLVHDCFTGNDYISRMNNLRDFHLNIARELIPEQEKNPIIPAVETLFQQLENKIQASIGLSDFDLVYDRIIPFGELLSTKIVYEYMHYIHYNCLLISAFDWVKTDNYFRFAKVDMETSADCLQKIVRQHHDTQIFITQGFIGSSSDGSPTTLGREGSDYTAALAAAFLEAESVTVWKDVPGLLNADPKRMENARKIEKLSYREAIELAYYGAKVIHPKTIKPIENKSIPLFIKSFLHPETSGTIIHHFSEKEQDQPIFIFHENQILVSISVTDLSFITEESLYHIFGILSQCRVQVHLMQSSAVSFSICIDNDKIRCRQLLEKLSENYDVRYNTDLELITIRHHQSVDFEDFLKGKEILLEQRSRTTAQFVVRN